MDSPILLLIPLVVMMAPVLIVLTVMRYRRQQTQSRYQTLLQLADKGVELPPQLGDLLILCLRHLPPPS